MTNADHARANQAGTVFSSTQTDPTAVVVKFDLDGACERVELSDLKAL